MHSWSVNAGHWSHWIVCLIQPLSSARGPEYLSLSGSIGRWLFMWALRLLILLKTLSITETEFSMPTLLFQTLTSTVGFLSIINKIQGFCTECTFVYFWKNVNDGCWYTSATLLSYLPHILHGKTPSTTSEPLFDGGPGEGLWRLRLGLRLRSCPLFPT